MFCGVDGFMHGTANNITYDMHQERLTSRLPPV